MSISYDDNHYTTGNSKRIMESEKTQQRETLVYVATYNKNNPVLFTEIMENLQELKNKDKIKEILDKNKNH